MASEEFITACEKVGKLVDPEEYERRYFERTDGAILKKGIGFAEKFFGEQEVLGLTETKSLSGDYTVGRDIRVISKDCLIGTLFFRVENPHLVIWIKPDNAFSSVVSNATESINYDAVDEHTVEVAITKCLVGLRPNVL
jgi:hypothetical protein